MIIFLANSVYISALSGRHLQVNCFSSRYVFIREFSSSHEWTICQCASVEKKWHRVGTDTEHKKQKTRVSWSRLEE